MYEEYIKKKLKAVETFRETVFSEGAVFLREVLNDEWFCFLKNCISEGRGQKGGKPLGGPYFPFRWLYEQKEWGFINPGIKKLEENIAKKDYLRKKIEAIKNQDWMVASAAAFELSALVKFIEDGVLIDIDPKLIPERNFRADALIKIDTREILVELTTITKELVRRNMDLSVEVFSIPVDRAVYQITSKIKAKAEQQLYLAKSPVILIISLPQGIGATQLEAYWSIQENIDKYPQISSIIVSDTYCFKYGSWYFNEKATFKLNEKEKSYVSSLLYLNGTLKEYLNN